MIVACAGFIPPWPVIIALSVGIVATVAFVLAKKPAIGLAAAFFTVLVSGWLLREIVDVRASTATDRIYERYFGIDSYEEDVVVSFRNIAVATGTFTLSTWLSASLYHIKGGDVQEINAFTVGRSPNQIGAPHWVDMEITLALGDRNTPKGRVTQLGSAGQSRGGGRGGGRTHDVVATATTFLPGRFTSGTKRIVYVEGDRGFNVSAAMTTAEFASQNKGNYLVVELELH
ncbi:MAG: hypothetical protein KF777_03560 [Planctomycetaceae bacterium]|nr:hypothetical protein [Planctomycetaceae bacterium]